MSGFQLFTVCVENILRTVACCDGEGAPEVPDKTAHQQDAQLIALEKKTMYKQQALNGEEALHPRGRDACNAMQCLPVGGFSDTGVTHLQCASGNCNKCGTLKSPTLEGETDKVISWYAFKVIPTCTHCGPMQMEANHCNF